MTLWVIGRERPHNRRPLSYTPPMRFSPNLLEEILRRTDIVQLVGAAREADPQGPGVLGLLPVPQGEVRLLQGRERAAHLSMLRLRQGRRRLQLAGGDRRPVLPRSGRSGWRAKRASNCPNGRRTTRRARKRRNRSTTSSSGVPVLRGAVARGAGARSARLSAVARAERRSGAERFRLGYAPSGHNALIEHLKTKNITVDDMVAAGVVRAARGRTRPARFLLRPRDVSDQPIRAAASSPSAVAGSRRRRQAQIHQHRRDDALFQGPSALQFRHRARRRAQGRHRSSSPKAIWT